MGNNKSKLVINGLGIPKEMFTQRFAPCDIAKCKSACCAYGTMMGEVRMGKIKKLLPKLFPMMRPEAVRVVKKKGFVYPSILERFDLDPTHKHYNTRYIDGGCVFLNFDDVEGCVLQKYCKLNKMKYKLKPECCWDFPFDKYGNRLKTYKWGDLPCLDESKNKKAPPIYIACKPELTALLGKDGYKKLLAIAKARD